MGLGRREGFCGWNEGSSSSAKNKRRNTHRTRVQADRMSPKVASVFPEPEMIEDDCDLGKRLDEEASRNGEKDSLWLSSDCNSPSTFFSEYRLYDFPQLSLNEWMTSWLQISTQLWFSFEKSFGFFDGSRINPIEEACLVLEKNLLDTEKFLQEDFREEEVVTWLLSSIENDAADSSSVIFSESSVSSFEDSTGSESLSTPFSIDLKPSPQDLDLDMDRTGFWASLVDLDGKDFKWISDSDSVLDSFQSSDFPSSSSSGVSVSMSPLKNSNQRNAASLGHHTRKTDTNEVRRKLVFTSGSTFSKILAWKQRSSNKYISYTAAPSRSSKPAKTYLELVPFETTDGRKVLNQIFLEEEFASNQELPIEKLLGLDEFDGQEGLGSEFNKDDFSLDQSL